MCNVCQCLVWKNACTVHLTNVQLSDDAGLPVGLLKNPRQNEWENLANRRPTPSRQRTSHIPILTPRPTLSREGRKEERKAYTWTRSLTGTEGHLQGLRRWPWYRVATGRYLHWLLSKYCDESVCLSVCLYNSKTTMPKSKISMHLANGRESVFRRRWDVCTSGFVDVMFSHSGPMARHMYNSRSIPTKFKHVVIKASQAVVSGCLQLRKTWKSQGICYFWKTQGI